MNARFSIKHSYKDILCHSLLLQSYYETKAADVNNYQPKHVFNKIRLEDHEVFAMKVGCADTFETSRGIYNKNLLPQQEWITRKLFSHPYLMFDSDCYRTTNLYSSSSVSLIFCAAGLCNRNPSLIFRHCLCNWIIWDHPKTYFYQHCYDIL